MAKKLQEPDFVIVGAGVAGLRAAIALAEAGRVLVLTKQEVTESATQYAQGGIAVALSDEDEISLHLQDTIEAGDGLVNPDAAHVLVEEGPARIEELIAWGTQFDRDGSRLTFTREGAHSRDRILHAHGDSTGREIGRALYAKASSLKNVSFSEYEFTCGLLAEDGRVTGVQVLDDNQRKYPIHCSAVLLATGGCGQVYSNTTNPGVATGDGPAMALRAGAELSDMEFVQFHPTALYLKNAPRFLLSEALRGEGGVLRNAELDRFMPKYHERAELAPRDIVARAIVHELELCRLKEPVVYLDLTHLKPEHVMRRFPRIYETCLKYNVDITIDLIPVRPAAHYMMGGIRTDLHGKASLARLYAAGEAACTGVHGANRLASNSLLEGLVFGARAGEGMRNELGGTVAESGPAPFNGDKPPEGVIAAVRSEIKQIMWSKAGIVRAGRELREALGQLEALKERLASCDSRPACELANLHTTAEATVRSALARLESRGAHYRTDYPAHDDAKFRKHSVLAGNKVRFE